MSAPQQPWTEERGQQVSTLPSDIPGLVQAREHIRQAVANAQQWDKGAPDKVRYLRSVISVWLVQIEPVTLDCARLEITGSLVPDLPCSGGGNAQGLVAAIAALGTPWKGARRLHTEEQRLWALELLFGMLADLEGA